jgi:2-polyprenyl-3-methyl-5-hydroxy-6-metoxy-1,4-benzoquinol methylase
MDQTRLIEDVLAETSIPEFPQTGRYLSISEARRIVRDSIDYVGRYGDALTYKYLLGHCRRLSITLAMVPFAESSQASCLDVGCFGYMGLWAWRFLGYTQVEGIELHRDKGEPVSNRLIKVGQDELEIKIHNFDIAISNWPLQGCFDTVLFLETLEHINSDPMGVMLNVTNRMHDKSTLIMSVPNAVSYATLQRFVSGMPPWTYWFFHPDLTHEPRHCFEYTPIVLKTLLRAAGLEETAFRTICAYENREALDDIFAIGEALSIDPKLFGETLIAVAKKRPDAEIVRYPDCIYDSDRYYNSMFPSIKLIQRKAIKAFSESCAKESNNSTINKMKAEVAELRAQVSELADGSDRLRAQVAKRDCEVTELKARLLEAERGSDGLRQQLSKALFICEGFLTQKRMLESLDGKFSRLEESLDGKFSWLTDIRLQDNLRILISWQRKMLRPVHWMWLRLLPLRRIIARLRRRV